MKIMLITNNGAGFADSIEVPDGITVSELFKRQCPNQKATDFLIRVNRLPAGVDQVIKPGERVSLTPIKLEGAAA